VSWSTDGIRAKLKRVQQNLEAMDTENGAYIASHPYTIVPEFEDETGWHRIELWAQPPRPIFGIIIGEAIHNLRSALDQLAWQLATLDGDPPQPDKVQFPIFSTPRKDFLNHPSVNGMRQEHRTVLETLQPYRAGHGNTSLEQLAWISNTDKHRLVHTTASHAGNLVPNVLQARSGYSIARSEFGFTGLLEGGTEIGRLKVEPPNPDLQVDMQFAPAISVAFGDPGSPVYGFAADGLLKQILEIVEGLVAVFDRDGQSGSPPWP
jgi:hypothetical protein